MIPNRTKRTEKLRCSFLSKNRKEQRIFQVLLLYNLRIFMITGRTKRTEKLPCSFLRKNRKEQGVFHVLLSPQHLYIHDYRQLQKNREITLFLSQAEQKVTRNFHVPFNFNTTCVVMIADSDV